MNTQYQYHFARPVPLTTLPIWVDMEELGAANLPEVYLSEAARDQKLGAFGDGLTFIKSSYEEVEAAGVRTPSYAIGHELGSAECKVICKQMAPYWALELFDWKSLQIIINRQHVIIELRDGKPVEVAGKTVEILDYARETIVPLLADCFEFFDSIKFFQEEYNRRVL